MSRLRWAFAWAFYWTGDAISHLPGWMAAVWVSPYTWFMVKSSDIQGAGDNGPWRAPETQEAKHE